MVFYFLQYEIDHGNRQRSSHLIPPQLMHIICSIVLSPPPLLFVPLYKWWQWSRTSWRGGALTACPTGTPSGGGAGRAGCSTGSGLVSSGSNRPALTGTLGHSTLPPTTSTLCSSCSQTWWTACSVHFHPNHLFMKVNTQIRFLPNNSVIQILVFSHMI